MTKQQTILCVAVGLMVALIAGCLVFLPAHSKEDPKGDSTTDTNIRIPSTDGTSDPTDTDINEEPVITPPPITDPSGEGTVTDTNPPEDGDPKVENETAEDVTDKTPEIDKTEGKDTVVNGVKDPSIVETGPASGEDRNDDILAEKEDKAPEKEPEVDKPVIVEDEKTSTEGGGKGDAQIRDEETNVDDGNKNGPVYNPSLGGDNPFDNDTKTEIDDTPVEDYVGEGEDRPGEGIHF